VALLSTKFDTNTLKSLRYPNGRTGANGGAVFLNYSEKYKPVTSIIVDDCSFVSNESFVPQKVSPHEERSFAGGALCIASKARLSPLKLRLRALEFNLNQAYLGMQVALPPPTELEGWTGAWDPETRFVSPGLEDPKAVFTFPSSAERPTAARASLARPPTIDSQHRLPPDCFDNRPPGATVRAVVVHSVSAVKINSANPYDTTAILDTFKGKAEPNSPTVSAHYLIDRGGRIYRLVDDSRRAWHAGRSKMPDGEEDVNNFSVGIELANRADEIASDAQYEALTSLILDLKRRHKAIAKESIIGHDTIRALWNKNHPAQLAPVKDDPGPLFLWSRLFKLLDEAGFDRRTREPGSSSSAE
jgi:hypothetical protein